MLCKIADLITEIPEAGGIAPRCQAYLFDEETTPDVILRKELFRPDAWPGLTEDLYTYMETGEHFYGNLLLHDGLMLHASAVAMNEKAYLFSGPCGMGKSTHTRLWQQTFGDSAQVFNDDKPALRRLEDRWYAYGTPWCGKDGINVNRKVPLAGICFLQQSNENSIRRLPAQEALSKVVEQTLHRFVRVEKLDAMLTNVGRLVMEIPVFELKNRPDTDAVMLSHKAMLCAAEELGL